MPSTTNFGWTTPADTDYVKDGASAIRTLAGGIDTSMAQLKGGTTGQILSKTNGTDMSFTWINNDQGDLTAITAGTGISVTSGTGPIPTVAIDTATTVDKTTAQTLTNKTISATSNTLTGVINNTLTTTTGDLIYASSANNPARLGIGSTGQVLTVSGGVPTWAAAAGGGGKLAQVVQGSYATLVTSTSSSYADTGLTVSITPTASTSKVLVLVNLAGCGGGGNSSYAAAQFKLFRGTTEIQLFEMAAGWNNGNFYPLIVGSVSAAYLDSPSTTSSTSYKVQIAAKSGDNQAVMNFNYSNAYSVTPKSTITVLEILA